MRKLILMGRLYHQLAIRCLSIPKHTLKILNILRQRQQNYRHIYSYLQIILNASKYKGSSVLVLFLYD